MLSYRPGPLFPLTLLVSVAIVTWWVVERHAPYAWVLQDLLGFAFVTMLFQKLSFLRPWMVALLMCVLFCYDIFMVFITPYFTKVGGIQSTWQHHLTSLKITYRGGAACVPIFFWPQKGGSKESKDLWNVFISTLIVTPPLFNIAPCTPSHFTHPHTRPCTQDGVSVMEKAAIGPVGSTERLPIVFTVMKFIYPTKLDTICSLSRPYGLLGYGDVGIPGLLVTLGLKHDLQFRHGKCFKIYYATAGIGEGIRNRLDWGSAVLRAVSENFVGVRYFHYGEPQNEKFTQTVSYYIWTQRR